MPDAITEKDVYDVLSNLIDPVTGTDIVSAGVVSGIVIRDTHIGVMISVSRETQAARLPLQQAVQDTLMRLEGVTKVTPVMTAQSAPADTGADPRARATWNLSPLENVRRVIAIASGKGGVGKSTVTVLLAHALARRGLSVGIVDADIYGPSIPHLLGLSEKGKPALRQEKMVPFDTHGIQCMSVGFLLEAGQAAIMRGPMVSKTLRQLLRGTAWGQEGRPLDILLMDMPPGTGDVQLSMVQQVPLSFNGGGAILVTTPSDLAVLDARRCADMFVKTQAPMLGVIENMSWLEDASGVRIHPFGQGGGDTLARETGVPLLGRIPLRPELQGVELAIFRQNDRQMNEAFERCIDTLVA